MSPVLTGRFFTTSTNWEAQLLSVSYKYPLGQGSLLYLQIFHVLMLWGESDFFY